MKTGIMMDTTGYGRYGDKKYQKLRELGYSCADFSLSVPTKCSDRFARLSLTRTTKSGVVTACSLP